VQEVEQYGEKGKQSHAPYKQIRLQGRARVWDLVARCVDVPRFKLEAKVESMAGWRCCWGRGGVEVEERLPVRMGELGA